MRQKAKDNLRNVQFLRVTVKSSGSALALTCEPVGPESSTPGAP